MGRTSFAEDDMIPVYNRDLLICWSVADFSIENTYRDRRLATSRATIEQ